MFNVNIITEVLIKNNINEENIDKILNGFENNIISKDMKNSKKRLIGF